MKKPIETERAPAAIGPYSQSIMSGNTLYVSGQIPLDPVTGQLVSENISEQTEQVFRNIDSILEKADTNKKNILKTTIFITDMRNFSKVNDVYAAYFEGTVFPARSTIEVSALPKDAQVEIEVIASL